MVTEERVSDTECKIDYVKVDCVDNCEAINCGIVVNCTGVNCTCQTGFLNVENFCEDLCEGIKCGSGGDCLKGYNLTHIRVKRSPM